MISLEKTRQTMQSLNLAAIIINGICSLITLITGGFALFALSAINQPEVRSQLTTEQLAQMTNTTALLSIASVFILLALYLTIFVLCIRNRKTIAANKPSLLPYYIGAGEVGFNFLTFLLQGMVPPVITLVIQGGLLALYIFSIRYARLLVDNSRA